MDALHPSIAPKPTAMQFWVTVTAAAERAWVREHEPELTPEIEVPNLVAPKLVAAGSVGSMIDVRA